LEPGPLIDASIVLPGIGGKLEVYSGDVKEQSEEKPGREALERIAND
jgi:hypothetical protein